MSEIDFGEIDPSPIIEKVEIKDQSFIRDIVTHFLQQSYFINEKYNAKDKELYVFCTGGYYIPISRQIKQICYSKFKVTSTRLQNEIVSNIKLYAKDKIIPLPPELIAVKNGLLNILTGELLPFDKKYIIFETLPYEYNKDIICERWEQYKEEVFPNNKAYQGTLDEFSGYCLYKAYPIQQFLVNVGGGGDGKGVFQEVVENLVGTTHTRQKAIDRLQDSFTTGYLRDVNVNFASENPNLSIKDIDVLKSITGANRITTNRKFQDMESEFLYVKFSFSFNEFPLFRETTDAIADRVVFLFWKERFRHTEKEDRDLKPKLTTNESLTGILNSALTGLERLLKQGHFSAWKDLDKNKALLQSNGSNVFDYINTMLEFKEGDGCFTSDVYSNYENWCKEHELPPESHIILTKAIKDSFRDKIVCYPYNGKHKFRHLAIRENDW